jgi:hypothetical protein
MNSFVPGGRADGSSLSPNSNPLQDLSDLSDVAVDFDPNLHLKVISYVPLLFTQRKLHILMDLVKP